MVITDRSFSKSGALEMFGILPYSSNKESRRCLVETTRFAEKQIRKLPNWIKESLLAWATMIETQGLAAMRSIPGYHDEQLKGFRAEQRSSRLSRSYRVIYEESARNELIVVAVLEVHKHDY